MAFSSVLNCLAVALHQQRKRKPPPPPLSTDALTLLSVLSYGLLSSSFVKLPQAVSLSGGGLLLLANKSSKNQVHSHSKAYSGLKSTLH